MTGSFQCGASLSLLSVGSFSYTRSPTSCGLCLIPSLWCIFCLPFIEFFSLSEGCVQTHNQGCSKFTRKGNISWNSGLTPMCEKIYCVTCTGIYTGIISKINVRKPSHSPSEDSRILASWSLRVWLNLATIPSNIGL